MTLTADSGSPRDCLILHAGALGDCVLTIHVAKALRRAGYRTTLAARSPIAAWASRRGVVNQFLWLERMAWLWNESPSNAGRQDSPSEIDCFDLVISFLGRGSEPIARRLNQRFGASRVVHVDPKVTDETSNHGIHITQQWLEEIARQRSDLKFEISDLKLANPHEWPTHRQLPHYQITTLPNALVHPGSGGPAKCCPLDAMEALVSEFLAHGCGVRWLIGPDEVERDGPALQERLERTAPVIFEDSVEAAAGIVAQADLFLGNDAGMTHVAALAGVHTVALFGPTDPRVWRPLGSRVCIVRFPARSESPENWTDSVIRHLFPRISSEASSRSRP